MGKRVKKENHLGVGHLALWKTSEISAAWINLIVLSYLTIYASDTLGLNVALVGTLLMASKILDSVTDLFAGWLVDNTHTKLGKGRPYEICIVGQTICTVLIFSGSPQWSTLVKCIWVVCMYALTYSVFGTLRNAGQNIYTIRHFKNNRELVSKQAAYGSVFVMLFSIIVSIIFPMLMGTLATSAAGWRTLILIFMIPATLIGVLRFIFCKEEVGVEADEKSEKVNIKDMLALFKSNQYVWIYALIMLAYNVMVNLSVGSYYFTYVLGNIGLAGLLSAVSIIILPVMFAFPALIKKIGSLGKMVFLLSWVGVAGYILCFFSGAWIPGVFLGAGLGTLGTLPVMYYGSIFIMDISTYNEMKGMPRLEGTSSALTNFASKVGSAMGSWVTGILLMLGGYISTIDGQVAEQPDSAILMIRVVFALVPLAMTLIIGFGCRAFSKLEKETQQYELSHKQA